MLLHLLSSSFGHARSATSQSLPMAQLTNPVEGMFDSRLITSKPEAHRILIVRWLCPYISAFSYEFYLKFHGS